FPNNAKYFELDGEKDNIAPFEFIPWVLSQCKTVAEAKRLCSKLNLVNTHFNGQLPNSPLHWIIADKKESITIESTKDGLKVYANPVGILTNNPPFDKQLFNLNNYKHLSSKDSTNTFSSTLDLESYSLGMGSIGLPGDVSSAGRFVRISFFKENSVIEEAESKEQFFHLLQSVYQPKGGTYVAHSGKYEYTIYTSCVDMENGIYYYKTYNNSDLNGVNMHLEDLDSKVLKQFDLITKQKVNIQNN
ncbi:MAG: linear amide C-N hydrolase, partial [Peptostreptococcaceae bacterium]|nr:linear amide C-N hydrolase [Peptostreptococcaceae bacterium]